jgi:hypothetical protein
MKKTLAIMLCLVLVASLALMGCGGKQGEVVNLTGTLDENGMDSRMSAADTFGDLGGVADDGTEAQGTAELDPGMDIQSLGAFYAGFADAQAVFLRNWGNALGQAGIQTTNDNILIPMDTIGLAQSLFAFLAAYDQGEDAMAAELNHQIPIGTADWPVQVDEGTSEYIQDGITFNIEWARSGDEPWYWYGFWQQDAQYLFVTYMGEGIDTLELDAIKTSYGYAAQLYDSAAGVTYRMSFRNDGSWDGGLGLEPRTSQPSVMTGTEDLQFAATATGDGDSYAIITGNSLEVKYGERTVETYPIQAGGGSGNTGSGGTGANGSGVDPALAAAALPYIGVWHASPGVGSGFSERFALYSDGIFVWAANDMDGISRTRYLAGCWDVAGGQLLLTTTMAVSWEGGEVVDGPYASFATDQVITNPSTVLYRIDQTFLLDLSAISQDSSVGKDTTTIGGLQCWSYGDDYSMVDGFWTILQAAMAQAESVAASGQAQGRSAGR